MTNRSNFTFEEVANRCGADLGHLRSNYATKADLLRGYYLDAWHRFVEMEASVPEFSDYTVAEKIATLVFSLCDEFDAVDSFAAETYGVLINKHGLGTEMANLVRARLARYIATDNATSMLVKFIPDELVVSVTTRVVLRLISERVIDKSTDKERTSALTDKTGTLLQSLIYTGAIDHIIDLARYLGMSYLPNK
jgi:AcrR family transcriptional regulator